MTTTRERKESVSTDNNENKNDIIKPENVIARLAPQSHCSKANKTASYHEGEKSILGSLWTDLNQRKAQGTVAEEPVAAHAVRQKKNHENVGAT